MLNPVFTFDDVLIVPQFSEIRSRAEGISTHSMLYDNLMLHLPVISSNMDTITGSKMALTMALQGGIGCLHRFMSIEENVQEYLNSYAPSTIVSVGTSENEKNRVRALHTVGARNFCIDVAHGASVSTVNFYNWLVQEFRDIRVIVGNFATAESILEFNKHVHFGDLPNAYKVGIGGGSMCTTRIVTGVGVPTLASVIDCASTGFPIIADGGIRTSGDVCKALAAGASAVMLGGMLSGTDETPGEIVFDQQGGYLIGNGYKKYRGSASKESYEVQGKTASHRTAEGESTLVPCKGPVANVLQQIEAGLRSSMSYVGAKNLTEYRERAKLIQVTSNGLRENGAHGK